MPKFNDFDMNNWKALSDIETDSLWIIDRRDNSGKHDGFYHGNFVPQIPRQLIQRYTKKNEYVLDPFMGSGTTAYEAETLERNFIGVELNHELVDYVKRKMIDANKNNTFDFFYGDSCSKELFDQIRQRLADYKKTSVQLAVLHPPYFDILKFSDNPKDLSNSVSLEDFLEKFGKVVENVKELLDAGRYLAVVVGDKYTAGQWFPLGFYCMEEVRKKGFLLKSIVVKNMDGNRGKKNQNTIWRYRALTSDYYIFKHEYIFIFKNGKRAD